MHPRAAELIRQLQLAAHPEGGYYRRLFTSDLRDADGRAASSAIFFLLPGGVVSRWHRVDADELWHYHEGAPLELLVAQTPDQVRSERLGPVAIDQLPQRAVPAQAWQAARSLGDFTLVGCTVAPEFRFDGFRLLADDPAALALWPRLAGDYPELL
ncbi:MULTISPECIES: cupin domain-containing protein [unclassified Pseudomonas]|uniref:cupin domain-containing protein n=1 Tax=unclassified Pseudomonas TaxID=196821 RepID=UPI00244CFF16|nr:MULTISPECIES: cupin domain-containing protein [unclassified Pseudomonas]MDG9925777.1 cupin domain-containing protein [Pseudomonas sp. GD04045]MDH0037395.1 cupin domain-containing protein [Pseudomonas sp. GD04019]